MTTSTISSSTTNNNNNVSTVSTSAAISKNQLGEAIESLTANDIDSIAEKMGEVFSQSLQIPKILLPSNAFFSTKDGLTGVVMDDAKSRFVNIAKSTFVNTMRIEFSNGGCSYIVDRNQHWYSSENVNHDMPEEAQRLFVSVGTCQVDGGYEYSYEHFLSSLSDRNVLRTAIGSYLSDQYRIKLSLDKEQTQAKGQLVFTITETDGKKELSRTSVHMKDTPPLLIK